MPLTERVKRILSWYASETRGTRTKVARLLTSGELAGTGKLLILPVDQGFEHGPVRWFATNPPPHDPRYHFRRALDASCNADAAPLGFLEAGAAEYAGGIPLILKLNNSDTLSKGEPCSAVTGSVEDALRLGCVAIGYTVYPGSDLRNRLYEALRELTLEAQEEKQTVVEWSYPRGSDLSREGERAISACAYAAQIACQLGAHVVKIKLPSVHIEHAEARKAIEKAKVPAATLANRGRYRVQAVSGGRRGAIYSVEPARGNDEARQETRKHAAGEAFGSIVDRNPFQHSPSNRPETPRSDSNG